MARIRTIKPDFWSDEKVGRLGYAERLLFIASWNLADDQGHLRWTPAYVRGAVFMYDDVTLAEVQTLMDGLAEAEMVIPYEADGQTYAEIRTFGEHQYIQKPSKPKFPAPPWKALVDIDLSRDSGSTTGGLPEGSGSTTAGKGREGKGREGEGNAAPQAERADIWEALYEFWTGLEWSEGATVTRSQRGRINAAVREAVEAGISASDIRARGEVYRREWRELERTPQALLANWHRFTDLASRCEHIFIDVIGGGVEYRRCRICSVKENG